MLNARTNASHSINRHVLEKLGEMQPSYKYRCEVLAVSVNNW